MAARERSPSLSGPPPAFVDRVRSFLMAGPQRSRYQGSGTFAAQLLWQRRHLWDRKFWGNADQPSDLDWDGEGVAAKDLDGFLDPHIYEPTGPDGFGEVIATAIQRLIQARDRGERVAIWGDFDADGLTATAVLWEGLGQFFESDRLSYTIPNRLTDFHGLNETGLRSLADQGVSLVVTCDTGSTNLPELELARELGLDVIVTDHHSLPVGEIPAVALINPRSLPPDHPLATLSGVAVAFKLVEALYEKLPTVPTQPLAHLLDLVAIGLIADWVELRGDCRYLAQRGIEQLKNTSRPGLKLLLKNCQRQGDRPTDISFGIGPRINAISRIQGDAQFGVDLLTSGDRDLCRKLAMETELANSRRKEIQRRLVREIEQDLAQVDRSTTQVLVLAKPGWPVGILGLVAGQIAERFGRPVLLLAIKGEWARGSARSLAGLETGLDLYETLVRHRHLLHRYGGHPMAAGVMVKTELIPLLSQTLNHDLGQRSPLGGIAGGSDRPKSLEDQADLTVTVADLNYSLFQELKVLEPCGMGNPPPRLLVKQAWFTDVRHANLKDAGNTKLKYIRTTFRICDESLASGCAGTWWGHYQDEIPQKPCDVLVELDFNARSLHYEVRLLDLKREEAGERPEAVLEPIRVYDWRNLSVEDRDLAIATCNEEVLDVPRCPQRWEDWQSWIKRAIAHRCALALTYSGQPQDVIQGAQEIYVRFLGIAKYLTRSGEMVYRDRLQNQLRITPEILNLGLKLLKLQGIEIFEDDQSGCLTLQGEPTNSDSTEIEIEIEKLSRDFLMAIQEEIFRQNYFSTIPVEIVQTLNSSLIGSPMGR